MTRIGLTERVLSAVLCAALIHGCSSDDSKGDSNDDANGDAGLNGNGDASVAGDGDSGDGDGDGDSTAPPTTDLPDEDVFVVENTSGHPGFASPHSQPVGVLPDYTRLYVANTPADTVDVFDAQTGAPLTRIHVGIDPVAIAVRPDGLEVWVSNHVSDTVSVIDSDPDSPTHHQVVATVQDVDMQSRSTRFDEPVGIAFTDNGDKAYVALSSEDTIAVVNVASRQVTGRLNIRSQDPRAIAVAGDRLYVVAFESGNQTQLSGCMPGDIDGDICTFDAQENIINNNNFFGLGYDADITRHPNYPDRDLFVFDTTTDQPVETINTIGTLLYGITATASGKAFIALTEARNDSNGRAGTGNPQHGLAEMENRAFLNQVGVVDCGGASCAKSTFELEPLPPQHPSPADALAIPYGIQLSDDESTLVVTAAGSNKLFTLNAATGEVLGRVDVGATPRGLVIRSDDGGAPSKAWVFNAVGNSVSMVDFTSPSEMRVTRTLELEDPTDPQVKLGRSMFNNAMASTTGTFACVSCHPDGNPDQLIWNLSAPACDQAGCTQFQLRTTMPIRGLRDTEPYHWDGIPGNPYEATNASSTQTAVPPTCDPDSDGEYACIRDLINGGLSGTMCDQTSCPDGPTGNGGALTEEERHAMAVFLLSVPHAQGRERPFDDRITEQARTGFFQWFHNDGRMTCGQHNCHGMPLLTRIEQAGQFDVPSFRGITDRFLLTNNGRAGGLEYQVRNLPDGPDERTFAVGGLRPGGSQFLEGGYTDQGPWQMFSEAAMGTSGAYGRQVTLSASSANLAPTTLLLDALEDVAAGGAIMLQGEGSRTDGTSLAVAFEGGVYVDRAGVADDLSRQALLNAAAAGELVLTLTGRMGQRHEPEDPQPVLWGDPARNGAWTLAEHFGADQPYGTRTVTLPAGAEGQPNLLISFSANGGSWVSVDNIVITANGQTILTEDFESGGGNATQEHNSDISGNSGTAFAHGYFTVSLDTLGLSNIEVSFSLITQAPFELTYSTGGGPGNIQFGTGNTARIDFPTMRGGTPMLLRGRHIQPNSRLFVDGRAVGGTILCTLGGALPNCDEEKISITLDAVPGAANATCPCPDEPGQEGAEPDDTMHLLQVQTPGGLVSNEFIVFTQ